MPVAIEKQLESNWCWAAVTASVNELFSPGSTLQQCNIAQSVLVFESQIDNSVDCCANPELCNIPAFLQDGLSLTGNLLLAEHGLLDFVGVTTEIDANRPVGVRIQWSDGGGHFLLIDGYREFSSGAQQVHVADPFYPSAYIFYSDLVDNYQDDGSWTDTFFIQPDGSNASNVAVQPGNGANPPPGGGGAPGSGILVVGPIVFGSSTCTSVSITSEIEATPSNNQNDNGS
jgi:hypothetical protein